MRVKTSIVFLVASLPLLSCGGSGGSNPMGGTGGDGSDVPGTCGISSVVGLASAGPAEGAWGGLFPIFSGIDAVGGGGVIAADGQAHFLVGDSEVWIGSVLGSMDGAVSSALVRYYRATGEGIGGVKNPGSPNTAFLGFGAANAGSSLAGAYMSVLSNCQPLHLAYNDVYRRSASLGVIAGVFTASDDNGYALTVTIHSDGQLDGSDTQGCVLIGIAAVPDSARNYYRAVADASSCGAFDGHYSGAMWLSDLGASNDNAQLNLILSNETSAIFRSLTR